MSSGRLNRMADRKIWLNAYKTAIDGLIVRRGKKDNRTMPPSPVYLQ